MSEITVISLGWGVQSFTIVAMIALGELPPVDLVIHSDTTHEREDTYKFSDKYTPWLKSYGIDIVTVRAKSTDIIDQYNGVMIPARTTENSGMIRRQCTDAWKRKPLKEYIKKHIDKNTLVNLLLGISTDEFYRMRDSKIKYIKHIYPLIDRRISRVSCVSWLNKNGIDIPPKSACVFCPYRPNKDWSDIYDNKSDYERAITADRMIRNARDGYELFLHRSLKPLENVDLRSQEERGQLSLWDEECSGLCGV